MLRSIVVACVLALMVAGCSSSSSTSSEPTYPPIGSPTGQTRISDVGQGTIGT